MNKLETCIKSSVLFISLSYRQSIFIDKSLSYCCSCVGDSKTIAYFCRFMFLAFSPNFRLKVTKCTQKYIITFKHFVAWNICQYRYQQN